MTLLTTGGSGGVAVVQFIAIKQLVDKTVSIKPLGSFSLSVAKGLNEWTTIASLVGGVAGVAYVIYDTEIKKHPLSDISLAIGSYGIVSLVAGVMNAFLDPMGTDAVSLDLSKLGNLFKGTPSYASPPAKGAVAGKFVR